MMKQTILLLFFLSLFFTANAQSAKEVRGLVAAKKYEKALPGALKLYKASPSNASYNYWYGLCLYQTGKQNEAERYLKTAAEKKIYEAWWYLGELYYQNYRFDGAVEAYQSYLDNEPAGAKLEQAENLLARAKRAARLLSTTEDIEVIDSVVVNKLDMLQFFFLSEEAGSLTEMEEAKVCIYTNQLQTKRYYAQKDTGGIYQLHTQSKLIDVWGDHKLLPEDINHPGFDSNFPFVLNDGVTLYFSAKSTESIGGYDLFVTRYNTNNDTYLAPEQLGMPFNSIYNDYMLAVDELNGVGFFVSDRFQEEDKAVVYTFIYTEKKNRLPELDSKARIDRALLTSIKKSWKPEADYSALLQKIKKVAQKKVSSTKRDFTFVINDNIIYYSLQDFESDAAKSFFLEWHETQNKVREINKSLEAGRLQYYQASPEVKKALQGILPQQERELERLQLSSKELEIKARNTEITFLRTQQ